MGLRRSRPLIECARTKGRYMPCARVRKRSCSCWTESYRTNGGGVLTSAGTTTSLTRVGAAQPATYGL